MKRLSLFFFLLTPFVAFNQINIVPTSQGTYNKIGAIHQTPRAKLHVTTGNGIGLPSNISGSTVAVFHKSQDKGHNSILSIIGSNTGTTGFYFGDPNDENAGMLHYSHANDQMEFRTNGSGIDMVLDNQYLHQQPPYILKAMALPLECDTRELTSQL